ncbi:MAG TPA: hypothetical protein VF624_00780 [Tepidisphaeraceae bacterium]
MPIDVLAVVYVRNYFARFPDATYADAVLYVHEQFEWALQVDLVVRELVDQSSRGRPAS